MAYATAAQAIEIYGTDYITIACDRNGDGTLDSTAFEKQLEIATRQMNSYVLGRYALPLTTPPEHFQKVCTDIAVYNSCPSAAELTEQIKDRYKEAIDYLKDIAANRIKLELTTDATGANASQTTELQTKSTIYAVTVDRQFKRDKLRGLL